MGKNFKFLSDSTRDSIRLKLYGDFDGSSACELINALKNHRNGSNQIFIDTNNLNTIHPFGMDVFKRNLGALDINKKNIIVTGKHRLSLEQRWCWLIFKTIRYTEYLFRRCHMNENEGFVLAERVQKRIQEKHPLFRLIKRRNEIEREFKVKKESRGPW